VLDRLSRSHADGINTYRRRFFVTDTQLGSNQSTDARDTAKEQAQSVAATTKDEAANVVGTAKDQAKSVTTDVKEQTRQLTDEARQQLTDHAVSQRDNAVQSLRSIGDELTGMAEKSEGSGIGTQLAREVGGVAHRSADFLQEREPGQLIEELRDLARRRPGAFLLGAGVAGLVVGRATRSAKSAHSSDSASASSDDDAAVAIVAPVDVGHDVPVAPTLETDTWGPDNPTYPAPTYGEGDGLPGGPQPGGTL
jgi:hypothetical protein